MQKNITNWAIWFVLALALLGQTVSASYGMSQLCDSLSGQSKLSSDIAVSPHHMASMDDDSCCENSGNASMNGCEMHSCMFVGLLSFEFNHSVLFLTSDLHIDQHYQHDSVTLDDLYRPPISI